MFFVLPSKTSATIQTDCTDAGSDGIADNIIVVSASGTNCLVDGVDDQVQIQWAVDNAISGNTIFLNGTAFDIRTGVSRTIGDWPGRSDVVPRNWGMFMENKSNITIKGNGKTITVLNASDYSLGMDDLTSTDFFFGIQNSSSIAIKDMKLQSLQQGRGNYKSNYYTSPSDKSSSGTWATGAVYVYNVSLSIFDNLETIGGTGFYGLKSFDNIFTHNTQTCETCYDIGGSSSMSHYSSSNDILNNNIIVRKDGAFGVRLEGAADHFNVKNNYVVGSDQISDLIEIYSDSNYNNIENNILIGNNSQNGIGIIGGSYNLIKNNIISGTRDTIIRITYPNGTNTNNSIIGNLLYDMNNNPWTGESWGDAVGGIAIFGSSIGIYTQNNCLIEGNTISNTYYGVMINHNAAGSCVIKNNIIVNQSHEGIHKDTASTMTVVSNYNDVWNNTFGNFSGVLAGAGDISVDPLFFNPTAGDFHLKSQSGRWSGTEWLTDMVTSSVIDAGDPASAYSFESDPNGSRINMGFYGNTAEASKSGIFTIVYAPAFSPVPGTYSSIQTISISSATSGATIYYTINGHTPTATSSVYSSPIAVSSTATIKAIAVKSGLADSSVVSATYTVAVPILTSVAVSPSITSIQTGLTQQFIAIPKDQFGNAMTGVTIFWISSNMGSATINSSGLAIGIAAGFSVITASSGAIFGTASLTVVEQPSSFSGYWKFDEAFGIAAADSSGNKNTGTLINDPAWISGKINNGLNFDGTNDYISAGAGIGKTSDWTITAWIKPNAWGNACPVFSAKSDAAGGTRWGIYFGNDQTFRIYTSDGTTESGSYIIDWNSTNYPSNKFTFISAVVNGTSKRWFRDGLQIGNASGLVVNGGTSYGLSIGRFGESSSCYFNGIIDEVKVYNKALSSFEIMADYNAGLNPISTPTPTPTSSADLNSDSYVNSIDFGILMSNWNITTNPPADINQDGIVNSVDFGIMMSQWG